MTVLQIIGLVVGIVLLQLAIWLPLLRWLERRLAAAGDAIRAEVAASSETLQRGPELAHYRGASAEPWPGQGREWQPGLWKTRQRLWSDSFTASEFSAVKGTGMLALTDRRVVFRKATGPTIEFSIDRIEGVREDKWFLRSARGGRMHLIVRLSAGTEVGFMVSDHPAWMAVLGAVGAKPLHQD